MVLVKVGDLVEVNGVEAKVETHWAQNTWIVYKLDDGREIVDLHKKVLEGGAKLVKKDTARITPDFKLVDKSDSEFGEDLND
jgi:hypothetical protein